MLFLWLPVAALAAQSFAEQHPLTADSINLRICSVVNFQLPGRVAFSSDDSYQAQTRSYWSSSQGELASTCRVTPRDSNDLQKIMFLIRETNATFAIKSGGHSPVANTSNTADGIVIDLELLNHVTVDTGSEVVDVGTGARWADVYSKLRGTGYGVAGARLGSVGAGGYLLGGGLSTYSGVAGWACNQIVMLEVVLANGTLLEVDKYSHPQLFMALKGGASNFGVVTRFRLRLLKDHESVDVIFAGYGGRLEEAIQAIQAIIDYTSIAHLEPEAAVGVSISWQADGGLRVGAVLTHQKDILTSKVMTPFFTNGFKISTHRRLSQFELARFYDESNPFGFRQYRATTTIRNDFDALFEIVCNFADGLYPRLSDALDTALRGGFLIQLLPMSQPKGSKSMPQNMLGLENDSAPLLLLSVDTRYSAIDRDSDVEHLVTGFIQQADDLAASRDALHAFRYLNYASANQKPFEHQKKNLGLWANIMAVKQNYDPNAVFERQMKHPFKIVADEG